MINDVYQGCSMKKPVKRSTVTKTQPKAMFGVRLAAEEREALDKAAAAEDRSAAYIARRAILDWLKAQGYLK
jgi:hypothetical protein